MHERLVINPIIWPSTNFMPFIKLFILRPNVVIFFVGSLNGGVDSSMNCLRISGGLDRPEGLNAPWIT